VIDGCRPFLSPHFNLTVEIPLKAIVRGYSFAVVPISWRNRKLGLSSLRLEEMGSRYLYIVLNVWLEKMLTKGDYRRHDGEIFVPWTEDSDEAQPTRSATAEITR
jgi:dolichol-phosphate mannosyltransferase